LKDEAMSTFSKIIAAGMSLAALAGGTSMANATSDTRALSLNVKESRETVEIEVVADSPVTQQIEFEIELTGASNSRHKSTVSVASGDRQVLSKLRMNTSEDWCAKLKVSESSGWQYTLTAGECGLI